MTPNAENFFHVPTGNLYIIFGEMFIQTHCQFFNWVVFFIVKQHIVFKGVSSEEAQWDTIRTVTFYETAAIKM